MSAVFSSQGSHVKRNVDPWNWSRGKGARKWRRDRLVEYSSRCTRLTSSRRVGDNGIRGQDVSQPRHRNCKTIREKKEMMSAQSGPQTELGWLPAPRMALTQAPTASLVLFVQHWDPDPACELGAQVELCL